MSVLSEGGPASSLQDIWAAGARALREGRPAEAKAAFVRLSVETEPTSPVWLGLALAERALGDGAAELAALQRALALDPRNLHALIAAADYYDRIGDARAASAYYDTVAKLTANGAGGPAFAAEAARAERMRARYAHAYNAHLAKALEGSGLDGPEGRRVRQAIDLLTGRAELYLQQPKGFYFPELPNIAWAERADFPWLDAVEAATPAIRAEVMRILEEDAAFEPYVQAEPNRPFFDDHGMLGNPNWSAFYLWKGGQPVEANIARCPATAAAMESVPLCRVPGRTPSVLFSLLRPGAHIRPHHGFTNARYICHLPLIVPDGCAMRVGAETRPWTEGKACVFDDSIEHEAWNRNEGKLRVVMIFDVWRPELSPAERELVSKTLQAVDAYAGGPPPTDD